MTPPTVPEAGPQPVEGSPLLTAYRIADELDSNHGRWAIQRAAEEHGIILGLPPVNEPNNRLREQLDAAQSALRLIEAIHEPRPYRLVDDDGVQHPAVEVCSTCKPGDSLLPVKWPCETARRAMEADR